MLEIAESEYAEMRPDFYGQGGFLSEMESEIAQLLGKEACVIMPSGTMAQPIALRIWSDRARNPLVAFHPTCHLQLHEQMGYQALHHLRANLIGSPDRLFTLDDLTAMPDLPASLLIELPQREIGGQLPSWEDLWEVTAWAKQRNIRLHLDGARLWESQPFYGRPLSEIVQDFDSVYVSFYKILFGLPGAALAGPADFIAEARIWMRRQGGNLVHLFPTAISAKLGLDRYLPEIPRYVERARHVAGLLSALPGVSVVPNDPPTNMMHLHFEYSSEHVLEAAGQIAEDHSFLILQWASDRGPGSKTELTIASAALEIDDDHLSNLIGTFGLVLSQFPRITD